ncbi:MAG: (Fe-S)-binding protein [Solirubrobacteraceae bacterium]|nr:(Fe-S)-binding protein [Patulibacter sp.]
MKVALFVTCVNDTLFPQTGRATLELLERLGCEVDFPLEQTCCGQVHANAGYGDQAIPLVKRFVKAFPVDRYDAIVCPSASCAAMVHEQYPGLAAQTGDAGLIAAVEAVSPKVWELSRFITEKLGVEDVGAYYPHRVTYHPTCHSLRSEHVGDAPLRLLRAVRGIDLVELPEARTCCGFGGTFAVKNAETSAAMLGDKLVNVRQTGAEVCSALDNSCLMHIGGGLTRGRAGIEAVHLVEILASTEAAA